MSAHSASSCTPSACNRAVSVLSTSPASSQRKSSRDAVSFAVELCLELGAILVTSYVASKLISKLLQPPGTTEDDTVANTAAEKRLAALLQRERGAEIPPLTQYERQIAQDVIDPSDIQVHFEDIGGIDDIKQELWELAVLPLQRPDLFSHSKLLQQPGGILLYGPPGTGKTMLAKAIAKEANATFLAVKLSKIMNKWFGESNKLIDAIFSLARKLAPSIIFIDELDTFLNPRDGSENSAGNAIKAEFLTLWDGITTKQDQEPVVVLGATNRPNQIDSAIQRRLPRMFRIPLPDQEGRLQILKLTLKDHPVDKTAKNYLPTLAKETNGYSGSDLKELCYCAARESIREIVREASKLAVSQSNKDHVKEFPGQFRPMSKKDLRQARAKVKRTGQDAEEYESSQFQAEHRTAGLNQHLAALSRLLSQPGSFNGDAGKGVNNNPTGDTDGSDDEEIPQLN